MNSTAHVIIWGFGRRTSGRSLFSLIEGDRQIWTGRPAADAPLDSLFARFNLQDGGFDAGGGDAGAPTEHVYSRFSGREITVVRYRGCAITDAEIAAARDKDVRIEVVDVEGSPTIGGEESRWDRRPASDWQVLPYPGERPDCSWRLVGSLVHRVVPRGDEWSDAVTGEAIDLEGRVFVLAYGSNATPGKLHGIDAVVLQATITDARAVWCNARRRRDDAVVATIVEVDGHAEACPVLAVRPADLSRVDGWELPAYRRDVFWGDCVLQNGQEIAAQVYVGGPNRKPLLLDGDYVPLHDAGHGFVDQIVP